MSRAERLEHPALQALAGRELEPADLNDRQRLAAVLQAAGLLSLAEVGGWRLADDFGSARFDAEGRLRSVAMEPGPGTEGALAALARFALRLFGGGAAISGRGAARAALRRLVARWASALDRGSADEAVSEILEVAPFLSEAPYAAACEALSGTLVVGGEPRAWRAGRRRHADDGAAGSLADLVSAGRAVEAVRRGRRDPAEAAADPLAFARALWATGRVEQALDVLAGRDDTESETLRAEALLHLGEVGAAREAVRRLEARDLAAAELIASGDVALRVLAATGEPETARDWAARALTAARGPAKRGARLLAALAAVDRGDLAGADRLLGEAGDPPAQDEYARLELDARLAVAQRRHDAVEASRLAAERLRTGRRRMGLGRAGRAWNAVGYARSLAGDFRGAERAYAHAARLLRRTDGPLAVTLAGFNLADARLRCGVLREVETILAQSRAHNRRGGNEHALAEDDLLAVRLELVTGAWQAAAERCRRRIEGGDRLPRPLLDRFAVLEARALGWLGRPAEAAAALSGVDEAAFGELEPEEIPFLLALAGATDRALEREATSPLARALIAGESPSSHRWRELDRLEPYRRARFVLDAELAAPGVVPGDLGSDAAAIFRRLGAVSAAASCERRSTAAWGALDRFLQSPAGDRAALEELFAALRHPEAELLRRDAQGERRLAGSATSPADLDERSVALADGELVLRARGIDEPLRAVLALLARDQPAATSRPEAETGRSGLLGESPALRTALDRLARFAASDLTVLILGENGTGKELAAQDVHRLSSRRKGPWVAVNCAGLSETLLLSELFGHARGAFTGADQARAGYFEAARGGTVFLDEIGDLPLVAQGSLLRVLQEGEIRRLGESLPRKVDVRIVAATNRDLESMVEQGRFRQDLFFRLKAATVVLPPLRERGQDVLLLAERFVDELRARGHDLKLTPDARRALVAHAWPGNVRELKNSIAAAAALAVSGVITPEHLDLAPAAAPAGEGDYHRQVEEFRIRLVRRALEAAEGSLAGAARQLGVTRQFLSQFVRKHGLEVTR